MKLRGKRREESKKIPGEVGEPKDQESKGLGG